MVVVLQAGVNGRICCCGTGIPSISRMMELQNGKNQITVFKYQRQSGYNYFSEKQSQKDNQEDLTIRVFVLTNMMFFGLRKMDHWQGCEGNIGYKKSTVEQKTESCYNGKLWPLPRPIQMKFTNPKPID